MTRKTRFVRARPNEEIKVIRGSSGSSGPGDDPWAFLLGAMVLGVVTVWLLVNGVLWVVDWIAPHALHFGVGAAVGLILGLTIWFLVSVWRPGREF